MAKKKVVKDNSFKIVKAKKEHSDKKLARLLKDRKKFTKPGVQGLETGRKSILRSFNEDIGANLKKGLSPSELKAKKKITRTSPI